MNWAQWLNNLRIKNVKEDMKSLIQEEQTQVMVASCSLGAISNAHDRKIEAARKQEFENSRFTPSP